MGPSAGLDGRKISSPPGFFLFISSNTGHCNLIRLSEEHLCSWMLSERQGNIKRAMKPFEIVNMSQGLKLRVPSPLCHIPHRFHQQGCVHQYMSRTVW